MLKGPYHTLVHYRGSVHRLVGVILLHAMLQRTKNCFYKPPVMSLRRDRGRRGS